MRFVDGAGFIFCRQKGVVFRTEGKRYPRKAVYENFRTGLWLEDCGSSCVRSAGTYGSGGRNHYPQGVEQASEDSGAD